MEKLLTHIHSFTAFTTAGWQHLLPALTKIKFEKDQYLLKAGTVCNQLFFISEGYCRAYYDKNGQDINTDFFFENEIATNISSFASGEVSACSIQACTPVTVISFDKQKLREVSLIDPEIEMLGRKCLQRIAIKQEKHAILFKLMTARERYEYLEQYDPELLQRVSLTQLSSYLGIARETLSRIRNRRR